MALWSPLWLSHRPWCYVTRSLRCLNAGPHTRPACAWHLDTGSQTYPHMIQIRAQKMHKCPFSALHTFDSPNCLIDFRICIIWMTTEPRRARDACTASDLSNWDKPTMNDFMLAVRGCNASVAAVRLKMSPRNSQSPPAFPSPLPRVPSPLLTLVGETGEYSQAPCKHTPTDWQHRDACKWAQAGRPCAGE